MRQEIKTPPPHAKKLFEWDAKRRLLSVIKRRQEYLYELAEDNTFVLIAERDKPTEKSE
ncbi:MAG: hypothetical protein FWE12_00730 [Oscillospiraceae bacterium]|nr:hypothetical protein [Oscillospiraceae bacterium]